MEENEISCPFCGETITILVDCSVDDQTYIEDCSVCCRPISIHVSCAEDELQSIHVDRAS